ncbi:Tyrosyl-DNA phosphodiesterase 2 [Bagarius yarrelli]|uniref:Tyrosyl-DNA phosphodiesterase 2 n=1 Tax=Bagarius yarrelli TaxID=175774 RepID=A0A556TNV2_BAGYA|nr:Tyrosyl-DNA phosphodiesterase 2 [Bagarius yarrelli]
MESVFNVEDTDEENNRQSSKRKETEEDGPQSKKKMNSKPIDCIDLTEDEPACSHNRNGSDDEANSKLSLISWNVDGLDTLNLQERARGLCSYLALYTPDVVFLQELIPQYLQYLKKRAVSYQIVEGNEDGYFTAMMVKRSRIKLQSSEIISYPTTQMMRNLLCAKVSEDDTNILNSGEDEMRELFFCNPQVKFLNQELCLMTSHLESCKDQATERKKQLKVVLEKIMEEPDNMTVIFGGDTNLRDSEEHCRFTWDTKTNSNKDVSYISRCRFDRIYLRPARTGVKMTPDHMTLVGMEKLDCGRYTSDHWGIYCSFNS